MDPIELIEALSFAIGLCDEGQIVGFRDYQGRQQFINI